MNKLALFVNIAIVAILCSSALSFKIKSKTSTKNPHNLIVNGNFEQPDLNGQWSTFDNIPGWYPTRGKIEIGANNVNRYLTGWGKTQILELDSHHDDSNSIVNQDIQIEGEKKCELKFKYGARTGNASSSMDVKFNGILLQSIVGKDKDIHDASFIVDSVDGKNTLTFEAKGHENTYGMTIDLVSLVCEEDC